jgi:hypothetical protein|tara:strand:+ start:315 stop:614 length:300 start_codon:yes stop_codon:yes gene_type:complete
MSKSREQWQAETKAMRDMAELVWRTSIPFEESYLETNDCLSEQFFLWEQQLMRTYGEMINMVNDRDLENEDYPTELELLEKTHKDTSTAFRSLGLPTFS